VGKLGVRRRFLFAADSAEVKGNEMSDDTKWCPRCRQMLDLNAFTKNRSKPRGVADYCGSCMKTYRAEKKDRTFKQRKLRKDATENTHPEKFKEAFTLLTDPLRGSFDKIAETVNLPVSTVKQISTRVDTRYLGLSSQLKDIQAKELIKRLEGTAVEIIDRITEEDIARASLRDKSISAAVFIDKAIQVRNKGALVVEYSEVEKESLRSLLPRIVTEMKRRGMTYELNTTTGQYEVVGNEPNDDDEDEF